MELSTKMYLYGNIHVPKIVLYLHYRYVIKLVFINFSSFGNVLGIKIIEININDTFIYNF